MRAARTALTWLASPAMANASDDDERLRERGPRPRLEARRRHPGGAPSLDPRRAQQTEPRPRVQARWPRLRRA
eukprot:6342086-Lingulodinium_polyedra.AAC.1